MGLRSPPPSTICNIGKLYIVGKKICWRLTFYFNTGKYFDFTILWVIFAKCPIFWPILVVRRISDFQDTDVSHIILKHMVKNVFCENHKSIHKIAKFRYFTKVITYSKSPDHMLQKYLCCLHVNVLKVTVPAVFKI